MKARRTKRALDEVQTQKTIIAHLKAGTLKLTPTPAPEAQRATRDLYDALTLEINRADSLAGLLMERLSDLDERDDAPSELYALSLVAESVSDKLQRILTTARALSETFAETEDYIFNLENGRRPGKGERAEDRTGAP